jgi:hypothetical protein
MCVNDPHLKGADRVREVFARVRRGDARAADLYAEDAVLLFGADGQVSGREAIRAFYAQIISSIAPQPQVEGVLESPPFFVAIVNVPTQQVRHRALDLFEVDDGGIRKLEIFSRR